ncbi:dUTP diphosphatase [Nanoarchaeota archaeon]
MKLKIERLGDVNLPKYSNPGDAGLDLHSNESFILKKGEKKLVKTGIKMGIPEGHVGLIWDRSGLAAKNGIHVLAGVVDSSYRGEVGVVLKNFGDEDFEIEKNSRIAQMLIQPVLNPEIIEEELKDTERGEGGFGSTGL